MLENRTGVAPRDIARLAHLNGVLRCTVNKQDRSKLIDTIAQHIENSLIFNRRAFYFLFIRERLEFDHIRLRIDMPDWNKKTFASLSLDARDKKAVSAWIKEHGVEALSTLQDIISWGYKVSMVESPKTSSVILSVIGTEYCQVNQDLILSSHAGTVSDVILLSGYKIFEHCKAGAWPTDDTGERWG